MHRQSLGSPAAKLHANGVVIVKDTSSSSSPSSSSPEQQQKKKKKLGVLISNDDEDEKQNKKPHHKTTPSGHPEKLVHLIPLLTLLCIFILYLNSHDPSQNDSTNIEQIHGALEIGKSEALGIGSMRNLQGVDREGGNSKNRLNRKIGDF
ncbi:uncharacterized protein [Coffea arabica]|uniref:Uncharacterized protein isoform X2 n=1 Tax=Coffea arabica TaxID=13443 RepID=A0A6P6TX58_COFAR|nr:uncharacterized protein LOC113705320 isoform X2 [Coffea arabica]